MFNLPQNTFVASSYFSNPYNLGCSTLGNRAIYGNGCTTISRELTTDNSLLSFLRKNASGVNTGNTIWQGIIGGIASILPTLAAKWFPANDTSNDISNICNYQC